MHVPYNIYLKGYPPPFSITNGIHYGVKVEISPFSITNGIHYGVKVEISLITFQYLL